METPQITLTQAFWLFVNSRFIITLVFIPAFVEMSSTQNVIPWLLLSLPMDLLFVLVFVQLWKQYPNQTLMEYCCSILGFWMGKAVGLLYLLYFILQASLTLRIFDDFLTTRFFPHTPVVVIGAGMVLIAAYAVNNGLETLARCAGFLVPLIFLSILLLTGLAAPEANWRNVIPAWDAGFTSMLVTNIPGSTRWNEVAWMAMIVPFIADKQRIQSMAFGGILFLRAIWLILLLTIVAIFGTDLVKTMQFPTLELVQIISIGNFLERIDAFVLGLWVFGVFLKIGILYYVLLLGASQWFGLKQRKLLLTPMGLIVFILSLLLFPNIVELKSFGRTMIPVDFIFVFVIPLLMLIVHSVKTSAQTSSTK